MARFPGAIWKPITASKGRRRLTVYNRMNLHVAVSEGASLHSYFNQSGIADSHFYVRRDGTVEQYVDTAYQAFADLEGNDATISVETQGMGTGTWTPEQLASLVDLYVWAVRTHGIARKMASSSKVGESSRGLSWHRLGCDGNFPALPSILAGRGQRGGGMHYSKSAGKICPGDARIKQIPSIFARAEAILGGASKPTTPTQEEPMADGLNTVQAKQLSDIHAALPKLLELHSGIAPKVPTSATANPEWINLRAAIRDIHIGVTRQMDDAVAQGVSVALKDVTGVDKAAITAGVVAEVRKSLKTIEDTPYVLTPKES